VPELRRLLNTLIRAPRPDLDHAADWSWWRRRRQARPAPPTTAPEARHPHNCRCSTKQLKRALFLSAFAALADPTSRAYYDRKRAAGKRHNAALICLARRCTDVLFAMLRDGTLYQPEPVTEVFSPASAVE
jgi:hypothetical protein